jgi:hypothetical protein
MTNPEHPLRRKWTWIGHTLRKGNEAIERKALNWNPQGKRRRGRPKQTWWRSVHEASEKGKSWSEVKRMARDRTRWRCFVDTLCPIRDNRRWWWWWWWWWWCISWRFIMTPVTSWFSHCLSEVLWGLCESRVVAVWIPRNAVSNFKKKCQKFWWKFFSDGPAADCKRSYNFFFGTVSSNSYSRK